MAILESVGVILPMYGEDGKTIELPPGAISAGYQNFLICIEMFFAAIALRYAFPITVYINEGCINADGVGRSVTMQSISSSLKVQPALVSTSYFVAKNWTRFPYLVCPNWSIYVHPFFFGNF